MIGSSLVAWLLWRALGPEAPPAFRGVQRRPADMPGRSITVGRHEFFVREAGDRDAPPIVLLHGWLYDGLATWHRVVPDLVARHRVIVPDLRSHGKSDRIRSRFEIADSADEMARVIDQLGVAGAPVVGYSMGGMVTQELALRHPGITDRVVLAATAAAPIRWPRWLTVPAMIGGRGLARIDRTLLPRLTYRYLMATEVFSPEEGAWLWQTLLDRDTDLYYETGFSILRFDATDRLPRLSIPVRSIIPTDDQLIPADHQRDAARIAGAEVVEIEGARHEAVLTHAGEVAKAIADFVMV